MPTKQILEALDQGVPGHELALRFGAAAVIVAQREHAARQVAAAAKLTADIEAALLPALEAVHSAARKSRALTPAQRQILSTKTVVEVARMTPAQLVREAQRLMAVVPDRPRIYVEPLAPVAREGRGRPRQAHAPPSDDSDDPPGEAAPLVVERPRRRGDLVHVNELLIDALERLDRLTALHDDLVADVAWFLSGERREP